MANSIALFKQYVPILDEVYKDVSKTAVLDGNPDLAQAGANANEMIIPMLQMDGLADYSRNSGYAKGDVTLVNQTKVCNFDRGRMFTVDNMDNAETAGIAFGHLAGEFLRTQVVPEVDAFRFACYASAEGIGKVQTGATLTDGEAVVKALRAAINRMEEDEVPMEDVHLFMTPALLGMVQDLDATRSREVMSRFQSVTAVPQSRFYTAISQNDGVSQGEEKGGYKKAATAKDINFMIVQRGAVIQFPKHIAPKVVTPEQNQDADAWKFGYRNVGIAEVYENKRAGVYVHHK